MTTHYSFLSWVRGGAAAVITEPDADDLPGHAKVPIELKLTTTPTEPGGKPDFINLDIHLYGPSDIIGIDPHQIIRTEPRHQTSNFMPNYLAAIEFDRPDFPWLFTPAKAEAQQGRLRPWLCLVVVRKQEGVFIGTQPGAPLPVLDIHAPAIASDELPDLSESWAWAHSQVLHEQGDANLKKALTEQPNLAISRLLCPRRLEAHQSYVACLVPTFEVGRKVGLGETLSETENDINTQVLKPAWSDPQDIKLPVYYHWEFSTGEAGDFEDLAKKLGPQALPAGAGSRKLYIGQSGVPAPSGQTDWKDLDSLDFAVVFRPTGFPSPVPPDRDAPPSWVAQLKNVLNASDWTSTGESSDAPRAEEHTPKLFDQEMQDDLKAKIDPKHVLPPLLISRIHAPANGSSSASAQSSEEGVPGVQAPIAHPTFPQSMYEVIRELKPDMLMAGADQLKENSVTLMETNPEFIEAFMVGLNHEMARELLWRGYPTDQRGTYFESFWSQGKADINKIHTWNLNSRLGQNLEDGHTNANGNGDQLALIIRAELLRRFPNTVIYAVKAKTERTLCKDPDDREHPDEPVEVYPIHRGQLTDDAMFILFNLTSEQVKSSPTQNGWFFMFQQQPTEARFGLDVTASGGLLTWDDLAWAHLETDPGRYISVARAVDSLSSINDPNGPKWNFNGAHMADIFLQKPYRVGIHADNLLS